RAGDLDEGDSALGACWGGRGFRACTPPMPAKLPVRRSERKRGRSARIRGWGRPRAVPARPMQVRRAGNKLAESEREQARAKQHEAGCGYCEEAFGHDISVTHDAPADGDAGPN